jgi:hypothetical protein
MFQQFSADAEDEDDDDEDRFNDEEVEEEDPLSFKSLTAFEMR